ncbi:MAG: hypothetical protein PUK70_10275 [Bacteroidales bacterium]|nr:hypothetical protein [Bacteroidales bacterium]
MQKAKDRIMDLCKTPVIKDSKSFHGHLPAPSEVAQDEVYRRNIQPRGHPSPLWSH